ALPTNATDTTSLSTYLYARANPLTYTDPDGREPARGANAIQRYENLAPSGQQWAAARLRSGEGCVLCHVTTKVWNEWGAAGVNPANGLPWDWTIDQEGYASWVRNAALANVAVQLFTGTGEAGAGLFSSGKVPAGPKDGVAGQGDYVNVPGSRLRPPTDAEIAMAEAGQKRVIELSTSKLDTGTLIPHVGDATGVNITIGPDVVNTTHFHPTLPGGLGGQAIPSLKDLSVFADPLLSAGCVNCVIGDLRQTLGVPGLPRKWITWEATTAQVRAALKK
ncbi:hypothetical protein ACIBBG_34195, partial [Micromonospora chersina]|uniref:hypothetical protein n=1 Tax=Micromonospora chersina TaxID=47854 RepID=UPI003794FC7F